MPEFPGTVGPDTLTGTAGADTITAGGSGDRVFAGDGGDVIYGGAGPAAEPTRIEALRVAAGLASPLYAASPPGDPDRLFIVEQHTGRIRILDLATGQMNSDSFLDLPDASLAAGGEQGLLGLAFHPNYAANGLFYVNLTNAAGDTEVREYRRADANHADAASARAIIGYDQPFDNHNGGWLGFGPDGMLYIASGDGGSSGDPQNNAQNLSSLLGKVLRIDVNSDAFPGDAARNYAIPSGNPFAGPIAGADEIWHYGLRNPWRMSFDSVTGDLWIGDVGQAAREEIDVAPAGVGGLNFGWRFREGFQPYTGVAPAGLTDPILDYDRSQGFSVTGGYVYHGPGGLDGAYFFADFGSANLWTVRLQNGQAVELVKRNSQLVVNGGDFDQIASFGVDGRGRLYTIGLDGDVHRLTPNGEAGDGQDYLRGEAGNDRLFGGPAFDDLHGNTGDDTVSGGDDGDWVVGGQGSDVLYGDDGDDLVLGQLAADTVDGGAGNDIVRGGQANDILTGGTGSDWLSADRGDDTVSGGTGADTFNSFGEAGLDRITDFNRAEGDRVRIEPGYGWTVSQQGADVAVDIAGGARVLLAGVSLSSLTGDWIGN